MIALHERELADARSERDKAHDDLTACQQARDEALRRVPTPPGCWADLGTLCSVCGHPFGLHGYETEKRDGKVRITEWMLCPDDGESAKDGRNASVAVNQAPEPITTSKPPDNLADPRLRVAFEAGCRVVRDEWFESVQGKPLSGRTIDDAWEDYRRTLTAPPHEQTREEGSPA